jgi:glycosyltransferase involved in cell wall biosynthesis
LKKRILMVNEYSGLNTGYSVYGRNLFKELHKTGKYELGELSCYLHQGDSSCKQFPWRCYPNVPHPEDKQNHQVYTSDPANSFGKWNFEKVCLDFKPDIVIGFKDFWMEKFVQESPFRKHFKWAWMCPCDGVPIDPEWLALYSQVDGLFCYNDWSKDCLEKSGLKVEGVPSPVAEECFRPFDKKKLKEDFGLSNTKIVGVVSRNQARKLFPDILKSFRELLNRTKRQDILLYLHTQIYDQGWDIAELLKENGLTSKVILSYICRSCGFCFPGHYADDIQTCKRCHQRNVHSAGVQAGFPSEVLAQVYGIMDVMVQWSCSEGFGMPMVESAACGTPIVNVGYTAMSDVGEKVNGEVIEPLSYYKDVSTKRLFAVPNNEKLVDYLEEFFNLPTSIQSLKGMDARQGFEEHYGSWEKSAKIWESWIDRTGPATPWNSPPNILRSAHPSQCPPNLTNSDFVKWCILYVLGDQEMLHSFFALRVLKDLNHGFIVNGLQRQNIGRNEIYGLFHNMRNRINSWEEQRIKNA